MEGQYQEAVRSLESLQATLNEIRSVLSTPEPDFCNAVRAHAQLDDSTSSIAVFHDRILRKYENTLGLQPTGKAFPKIWKKLTWAFDAAKDLAEFRTQLSMQLQVVGFEMAKQQWRRVSTIAATTTAADEFLRFFTSQSLSEHALTLGRIEDAGSHLKFQVSDFRALLEMQNEHDLEVRKSYHTEIKNLIQSSSDEAARTPVKTKTIKVEHHPERLGDLSQDCERITRLSEDVQSQEDKSLRRPFSEQAQQFLQIQQGIDDVKAFLMSNQSTVTGPPARNYLRKFSLVLSGSSLSKEVRRFILYLGAALQNFRTLILCLFPHACQLFYTLSGVARSLSVPSWNRIKFQNFLGEHQYFNANHFFYFEVFEAFLRNDFRDKPGRTKVLRGRYLLIDARNEKTVITKTNWEKMVGPGSYLIMSVIMQSPLEHSSQCLGCTAAIRKIVNSRTNHCQEYHSRPSDEQDRLSKSQISDSDDTDLLLERNEMKYFKHMHLLTIEKGSAPFASSNQKEIATLWYCGHCRYGPISVARNTHCFACNRPRDQYARPGV